MDYSKLKGIPIKVVDVKDNVVGIFVGGPKPAAVVDLNTGQLYGDWPAVNITELQASENGRKTLLEKIGER